MSQSIVLSDNKVRHTLYDSTRTYKLLNLPDALQSRIRILYEPDSQKLYLLPEMSVRDFDSFPSSCLFTEEVDRSRRLPNGQYAKKRVFNESLQSRYETLVDSIDVPEPIVENNVSFEEALEAALPAVKEYWDMLDYVSKTGKSPNTKKTESDPWESDRSKLNWVDAIFMHGPVDIDKLSKEGWKGYFEEVNQIILRGSIDKDFSRRMQLSFQENYNDPDRVWTGATKLMEGYQVPDKYRSLTEILDKQQKSAAGFSQLMEDIDRKDGNREFIDKEMNESDSGWAGEGFNSHYLNRR